MSTTPNPPGWYPVNGDPYQLLYWDGRQWVARARFSDGAWSQEALPMVGRTAQPMETWTSPSTRGAGGSASEPPDDGLQVAVAEPARQRRLTVLFRFVLALPHLFALTAVGLVALVAVVAMWFVALFTKRVPPSLWKFVWDYLQWSTRVYAYLYLLTDRYPPFELGSALYPVHMNLSAPGEYNRSEVFFRGILALPATWMLGLASYGVVTVGLLAWLTTLLRGELPRSFHVAFTSIVRFQARSMAYVYLLTNRYPVLPFADSENVEPPPVPLSSGARSVLAWSFGSGVLVWFVVAFAVGIPSFFGARADLQLSDVAQSEYVTAVSTYGQVVDRAESQIRTCAHEQVQVTCLASALQNWGQGATSFANSINDIAFPSGVMTEATQLGTDTQHLALVLKQAAALGTPTSIAEAINAQVVQASVRVGQDIDQLTTAMGSSES